MLHAGVALGKVVEHGYELADTLAQRAKSAPSAAQPAVASA